MACANVQYTTHDVKLSDDIPAYRCLEPMEAHFLYKQIFAGHDYTQYGITIKPGDVVVDVGGNTGMFAVYAIQATKGDITMYCFEPIPALAQICEHNAKTAAGAYPKCKTKVFPFGLTAPDHVGPCQFDFFPRYSLLSSSYEWSAADKDAIATRLQQFKGSSDPEVWKELRAQVEESMVKDTVSTELRTFAAVRKEEGMPRIDLLKIDVEKAEWDVLCGLTDDDWAAVRQVAIETHVEGDRVERVKALLVSKGFSNIVVGDMGVPKYLAFKTWGLLDPPQGGDLAPLISAGHGLLCNIYATK